MASLSFVGNLVLDIILSTPHFPTEDTKTRALQPPIRSVGGNATNSALVASALLHVLSLDERNRVLRGARAHLIAADVGDGADADSVRAYLRSTRLHVLHPPPSPSGGALPTSYILASAETRSRTIVHHRPSGMHEMSADCIEKLLTDGGLDDSNYIHFEMRDTASCASFLSKRASQSRAILAVELERIRGTDTVDAARAMLRQVPHIAIVSRDLAADIANARDPLAIIAALEVYVSDGALLVVPVGADGVIASLALRAGADAEGAATIAAAAASRVSEASVSYSSDRFHVRLRLPAHVPAGGIVSTLGAGDCFNAALAIAITHAPAMATWWKGMTPLTDVGAALGTSLAFAVFVAGEACAIAPDNTLHRAELLAQKFAKFDTSCSLFTAVSATASTTAHDGAAAAPAAPLINARAPVSRHFVIPFSRVPPRWPAARDLERTRADVLVRALVSSIMVSRGARSDTTFAGALLGGDAPPLSVLACGAHVRALRPDESSTAGLLQRALPRVLAEGAPDDLDELERSGALNSREGSRACCEGLRVLRGGLGALVEHVTELAGASPVLLIATQGATPISVVLAQEAARATGFLILLGDDAGLSGEMLSEVAAATVRSRAVGLGPTELLASAAITLVHAALDDVFGPSSDRVRHYDEKIVCRVCAPA